MFRCVMLVSVFGLLGGSSIGAADPSAKSVEGNHFEFSMSRLGDYARMSAAKLRPDAMALLQEWGRCAALDREVEGRLGLAEAQVSHLEAWCKSANAFDGLSAEDAKKAESALVSAKQHIETLSGNRKWLAARIVALRKGYERLVVTASRPEFRDDDAELTQLVETLLAPKPTASAKPDKVELPPPLVLPPVFPELVCPPMVWPSCPQSPWIP